MSAYIPNAFQMPNIFIDKWLRRMDTYEYALFSVVVRKTVGWNKESDEISIPQIEKLSGMNRRTIIRKMALLEEKGFVLVKKTTGKPNKYSISKKLFDENFNPEAVTESHQGGDRESRGGVTESHQGGDRESRGGVTESHQGGDRESPTTVLSVKVLSVKRILFKICNFEQLTFSEISEFFKDAGMKEKQIDLILEKHSLQIIESEVKRFCYGIDNGAEIKNPGGWLAASFKQLATDGGLAFSLKTDKAFFASLDNGPEKQSGNLPSVPIIANPAIIDETDKFAAAFAEVDAKTEVEPAAKKPKRKSKRKQFDPAGFWNHVNGASTRYCEAFEQIWALYPNRKFKKESARYWNGTVKNGEDMQRIARALDNYKADLMKNSWREVQVGKTWFNNWQDWEDHTEMERVSIWSYEKDYGRKPNLGQFTWLEYKKENVEITRVWDSGYFQLKTGDQMLWK